MEPYADIATAYAEFADYARADSPCFAEWADGVAGDDEVHRWLGSLPDIKQQANLVFAAARWHGTPAPSPYAALRAALLGDDGRIRETVLARSTQTNEVGRLATLTPWLARISAEHDGRPLALVEAGASAGLCLYPDRHSYAWRLPGGDVVRAGEGPLLECDLVGEAPGGLLPTRPPSVAWRGGLDLNPLDVTDADAMAWLEGLVWPEQVHRRERLAAAVQIARRYPPQLVRGDVVSDLPGLVERAAEHGPVVVFHSAVVSYLEPPQRRRFHDLMTGLVASGACRWLANEGPGVLPEITATLPEGDGRHQGHDERTPFVLGLDGRAVARTHGHGAALRPLGYLPGR